MSRLPVWIDCDTGVDDAAALLLASRLEELEILGVSTVSGNVEVEKTTCNTLKIRDLAGASWPVYRGADRPWLREPVHAARFHGADGLGGAQLPPPSGREENLPAWDAMYEAAKARPGELEMVCVGPLTNLATAFSKYPALPGLLHRILIMGGAAIGGNATPAAEFNIYADPDSAQAVFTSGARIHMFGLDVTLEAYLTGQELDGIGGNPVADFVRTSSRHTYEVVRSLGLPGVSMHDSCPILYLVRPELFRSKAAGVYVETHARLTLGKTVTDLYSDHQFPEKNAEVFLGIDRNAFVTYFTGIFRDA